MSYLVSVECPCGETKDNIKVTDDIEGFGPGLLAAPLVEETDNG